MPFAKTTTAAVSVTFNDIHGAPIEVGALVRLNWSSYLFDLDTGSWLKYCKDQLFKVCALKPVPACEVHTLGLDLRRSDANKPLWYAGVDLRAVLRDENGALARLPGSPCDSFVPRYYRPSVLADIVEVVEAGDGTPPVGNVDYSLSDYEVLYPKYQALDHRFEGWSNRPTGLLSMYLQNSQAIRRELRGAVTSKGVITAAKLSQLAHRNGNRWLNEAIPPEAHFTDPFPSFMPYREEVNFEEIAAELTAMHKDGSL